MVEQTTTENWEAGNWFKEWSDYMVDSAQRSILFWDVMRKRGNQYLEHVAEGQPPVLAFDYEVIMEGRTLERPVNYALARISPPDDVIIDPKKRPVVVIDPRAGHGPGIGGSKRDSEIGKAFENGHPVYFVLFYPDPEPGQTLADVEKAEAIFIEEVGKLHPKSQEPAVIGNCQAGWAIAMLGADRPDLTGPMVINGSPLSYWSGVEGGNAMRYRGGLLGGAWMALLFSDLGAGTFDGAHLVSNFEDLNPANTFWTKQYNLYNKIDIEEKRYLDFEKWWGGFFSMTGEEIAFIVENLFVGNKLANGELSLDDERALSLKNLEDPMVVFASEGDNITPPQQALNWIAGVYGTVDEIKRHKQVIVYRVHEKIGHLGIFVSASVANKEHKEIISGLDMVEFLQPGLYEMVMTEKEGALGITDYNVTYEERDISDILAFDDGQEDEKGFEVLAKVSEFNVECYKSFVRPWVRAMVTPPTAEVIKQLNPQRVQRYLFSDLNPFMWPLSAWAETIKENRSPLEEGNSFKKHEEKIGRDIVDNLNTYRDGRDIQQEKLFYLLYDNPFLGWLIPGAAASDRSTLSETDEKGAAEKKSEAQKAVAEKQAADAVNWMEKMEEGGFAEGAIRIMLAISGADHSFDKREYIAAEKVVKQNPRLRFVRVADFREKVKEQSRILQTDPVKAISALSKLLTNDKDRAEALEIAKKIAMADEVMHDAEAELMTEIEKVLAS